LSAVLVLAALLVSHGFRFLRQSYTISQQPPVRELRRVRVTYDRPQDLAPQQLRDGAQIGLDMMACTYCALIEKNGAFSLYLVAPRISSLTGLPSAMSIVAIRMV
jgi:hypothetical protein